MEPKTREEARLRMSRLGSMALKADVRAVELEAERNHHMAAGYRKDADDYRAEAARLRALLPTLPEAA